MKVIANQMYRRPTVESLLLARAGSVAVAPGAKAELFGATAQTACVIIIATLLVAKPCRRTSMVTHTKASQGDNP